MATKPEQSAKVKKNLADLNQLEGNGFIQSIRRSISNNKDFYLVVGLGGVGTNAVYEVKKELKKKLDPESFSKFVRFLFVDSAKKDLTDLRTKSQGLITEGETLPLPFEGMEDKVKNDIPYMQSWVNSDLKHHHKGGLDGTGAGNRRQCGRVLISGSAAQNLLKIKVAASVNDLIAMNDDKSIEGTAKCHLIIVAGIAGGTGSGTVIDASYSLSYILSQDLFAKHKGYVFGFVVLPPAAADKITGDPEKVATGNSNGYAALKEIEYNMTRDQRGNSPEPFVAAYEATRVSLGKNLFDFCYLIDGNTTHGLNANPKVAAAKTVADAVLTIVAAQHSTQDATADGGGAGSGTGSLITAMSNISSNVEDQVRKNSELPCDNNYIFNALGYSECVIPIDLLTVYAAKKLFDKMFALYEACGDANDDAARNLCSGIGLNLSDLKDKIKAKAKIGMATSASKAGPLIEEAELDIQAAIEIRFNSQVDTLFKKRGPYYVVNLLNRMSNFLDERGAIDTRGTNKEALLEESARRIYLHFAKLASELNNVYWEVYTSVLNELKTLLSDADAVFTKSAITQSGSARSYSWTPISSNNSAGLIWINEMMDDEQISKLTDMFVEGLYSNKENWKEYGGDKDFNAIAFIRDFIERQFTNITEMNIQDFIAKCYSGDSKAQGLDTNGNPTLELKAAAKKIAGQLYGSGELLANLKQKTRYDSFPCFNVLLCPEQTEELNELIKQELKERGVGTNDYTSKNANTFSFFTSQFALPAEAFSWVATGEKDYQTCKDSIGRHICEGSSDWHGLPNLLNPIRWNEVEPDYQFKDECVLRAYIGKLLDTAKEYGLLSQFDSQAKRYNLKNLSESEFVELTNAVVTFAVKGDEVHPDKGVDAVYQSVATKLFDKLDTTVVYDNLADIVGALPSEFFVEDYTRPHNMPYPEHTNEEDAWEYTAKFLRKMYNVCISLQRTIGVIAALREMVIENNKKVAAEDRKTSFITYYGYGLVFFNEADNAWQYKDSEDNDRDLLLIDALEPWQEQFYYYFLQEKFAVLSDDVFEAWDEKVTTLSADREVLKQSKERKVDLATLLKENIAFKANSSDTTKRQLATSLKNVRAEDLVERLLECYKLAVSQLGG